MICRLIVSVVAVLYLATDVSAVCCKWKRTCWERDALIEPDVEHYCGDCTVADGPYCGYGGCNIFGCNCDGGCRTGCDPIGCAAGNDWSCVCGSKLLERDDTLENGVQLLDFTPDVAGEEVRFLFIKIDEDGDGGISIQEGIDFFNAIDRSIYEAGANASLTEQEVEDWVRESDEDGDGFITKQEFDPDHPGLICELEECTPGPVVTGAYLAGYACSQKRFDTYESAWDACCKCDQCNGLTHNIDKDQFTMRAGAATIDNSGEDSYLRVTPATTIGLIPDNLRQCFGVDDPTWTCDISCQDHSDCDAGDFCCVHGCGTVCRTPLDISVLDKTELTGILPFDEATPSTWGFIGTLGTLDSTAQSFPGAKFLWGMHFPGGFADFITPVNIWNQFENDATRVVFQTEFMPNAVLNSLDTLQYVAGFCQNCTDAISGLWYFSYYPEIQEFLVDESRKIYGRRY